jgi:hypothetical protein
MKKETEERTELSHEPEPGYRAIFYAVFSIAVLYLLIIWGVQ